jgi:RNA polymerase sigma-70 factor (ECF subfamily)
MQFEVLYSQYSMLVYNLALQYTNNIEDAQEITQDVLIKVHEKIDTFKHQAAIKTWIYRITINTSLDFLKAKQRKKRYGIIFSIFENSHASNSIDTFNHPGIVLEQKEAMKFFFKALNNLKENQRTAIILSKMEQQSHADIAAIMGITAKAVENLVARAKNSLQQELNKNEGK